MAKRVTVESPLTETRVSGKLYLRPPGQDCVFSTPIQTRYFHIIASGQLQLRTLFSRTEGVHLRELRLYLQITFFMLLTGRCLTESTFALN